jgi:transposase
MALRIGIDVASKEHMCFSQERSWEQLQNTRTDLKAFVKRLPAGSVIGIESTGGYGILLAELAYAAGHTVYVLQSGKVKKFRESAPSDSGKTDKIDAKAICMYLEAFQHKLHAYKPLPAFEAKLRKLSRIREKLADKLASLRNLLRTLGDDPKEIKRTLDGIEKRVQTLTEQIEELLKETPEAKLICSIPSVKTIATAAVLPVLRTIPFKDKYALDSYAGMNLKPCQSGKRVGIRRMSKEGDKHIRRAFYMCALSASHSKAWKPYYEMLIYQKKLKKVQALNALARKILHTVYGVYKSGKPFTART